MKVLVVYYSAYGHVLAMARAVAEGVKEVAGAELVLRRVQDFPEDEQELRESKHGKPVLDAQKDIPVCTLDDLEQTDAYVVGSPTRYGNMIAQVKRLIDSTGQLWLKGAFEGKPVGFFTSTATAHGGQETTPLTMMAPFIHLGAIIVGVPYSTPGMLHTEGRGGTPYGASTYAGGDNSLTPKPEDLAIAKALGKRVAEIGMKLRG
jgi:NAD(P)H dehydrogenase (quinone)